MNSFEQELLNLIGKEKLRKVQSYTIGIAGTGGLGSNCAFNLVRAGFKKFVVSDYDKIEYSNLNRQFYFYDQVGMAKVEALKENLLKINPDIEVEVYEKKLTEANIEKIFDSCQIIVEAFDNVSSKKMIVNTYLNTDKLLVSASGLSGWGNSDQIKIRKMNKTSYIVGDMQTEASKKTPPISPKVNITAAKEADIILNYVMEEG